MASLAEMFVALRPDASRFQPEADKAIRRTDLKGAGKHVGIGLSQSIGGGLRVGLAGSLKGAFGPILAAGAALGGLHMLGGFIAEARESAKVGRITENAIRATGGAAKITAAQVGDLATAISNKTGIDDEQIQTASNMLLTFKNIRNQAGKNNDIFNQATQAAADLSIQFGGMDAASKQLGKALNDPIKGTTALAKSGVTFTEQQKKQIKTLVESGRTLDAQKIILKEINAQVGGAAAAAADPMQKLGVIAGNVKEQLGTALLPIVSQVASVLGAVLPRAGQAAAAVFTKITTGIQAAIAAFHDGDVTSDGFVGALERLGQGVRAMVLAFKEGDVTSDGFVGVMERIGVAARATFDFFKTSVVPRLREFAGYIRNTVIPIVSELAQEWFARLQTAFNKIRQAIQDNKPQLTQLWNGFKDLMKTIIEKVIPFLARLSANAFPILIGIITTAIGIVGDIVDAFNAIKGPVFAAIKFITEKFLGFVGAVLTGAAKAFGWVPKLGPKLEGAAKDFEQFKNDVNRSLDGIDDEAIKVALSYSAKGINLSAPSRAARVGMATGGSIHGPGTSTSDSIPTMLSTGEHVVSAREVAGAGGHGALEAMRRQWRGMARGGRVFDVATALPSQRTIDNIASATARKAGTDVAAQAARDVLAGGAGGPVSRFRGVRLDALTIRRLLSAERMLGSVFRIMQGSYSTRVAASGSTHAGGGAMDTDNAGSGWGPAVSALRRAGFAAWHRTPAQGPWGHHIHSIAIGDTSASAAAKAQVRDFLRGGDGLSGGGGSTRRAGRVQSFDRGFGVLPPGGFAYNGTTKDEPLTRTDLPMDLSPRSVQALGREFAKALGGTTLRDRSGRVYELVRTNG